MNKYTADEIVEDILAFTGVKVEITIPANKYFYKLYSDYALKEPPKSNDTVSDLIKHMEKYLDVCTMYLLDEEPSEDCDYTTYYLSEGIYRKYGDYHNIKNVVEIFYDDSILSSEILAYNKRKNEFTKFVRNLH